MKDRATQLLTKYKSGALVTQFREGTYLISKEEGQRKIFGERKRTRSKKEENVWLVEENKTRDRKKRRISWKRKM